MNKGSWSKILALAGYSIGIIVIQRFVVPRLDEWRWILLGIFLLIMLLFQIIILLDINIGIPFSRKSYYILLTVLTIAIFLLLFKLLIQY